MTTPDPSPLPVCFPRPLALLSGVGALLLLAACAQPGSVEHHGPLPARVAGHSAMPGDNLPNPARTELGKEAMERVQNGVPLSHL